MKQNLTTSLMLLSAALVANTAVNTAMASDVMPVIQPFTVESATRRAADEASMHKWKISLVPLFASQGLDVASSYGMRELNPMLASPDGSFGAKGAGIKIGSTAAIVGIEYLIARKHPKAARIFTKINWSVSIVTAGFAAHNFAIR